MSAGTRAALVQAIQIVIEKELTRQQVNAKNRPGDGRHFAREEADEYVECAYAQLDEALRDFEKGIGEL